MTIDVKMLAASRHPNPAAPDLFTVLARYPRFIHAEAKTHRVIRIDDVECEFLQEISLMDDPDLSRNASSSRAIPAIRLIRDVLRDPAMPSEWGSNRPGMQAGAALTGWRLAVVKACWLAAMYVAVAFAYLAAKAGAHKQIVNRLIEPWAHITVVITATEWQNFFDLRCHPAADPTMRELAEAIRTCIRNQRPRVLAYGQWHTPLGRDLKSSVAGCARTSYLNHDGSNRSHERDVALHDELLAMRHLSPFEHQAEPLETPGGDSNLSPWWHQYRKSVE